MRKFTASLFLMAALSLGCLAVNAAPVMAEENMGTTTVQAEYGPFRYNLYQYPSHDSNYLLYEKSYVEFDARYGKYWMLEGSRYNVSKETNAGVGDNLMGLNRRHDTVENLKVTFLDQEGHKLAEYKDVRLNSNYSFPRDGKDYSKVTIRIESYGAQNLDVRFFVWDPVNAVVAKPIDDKK